MKNIFAGLVKYLKETRLETKKVVWPDRRYITVATVIILVLVSLTSIYIMVTDFALGEIFGLLMK